MAGGLDSNSIDEHSAADADLTHVASSLRTLLHVASSLRTLLRPTGLRSTYSS